MSEQDIIGALTVGLGEIAEPETVIGRPITVGAVTLIPVIRVAGAMAAGRAIGGGAAGGFRVAPVAMVVVRDAHVEVLPIGGRSQAAERLIERLPEFLSQMTDCSTPIQSERPRTGDSRNPEARPGGHGQSNTNTEPSNPSNQVPGR